MLINKLKKIRINEHNMSKKEFADYLGIISEIQLSRYERASQNPPLESALRISQRLNTTVNELWTIIEDDD